MARGWRLEATRWISEGGSGSRGLNSTLPIFFLATVITLSIIAAIIFSCADGASKDKTSAGDDHPTYGSTCGAGCGAACGG
ncbi:hypothetical protein Tsubulata_050347 [Turnera subulata]|uniref:Uncharacterized protein n=1 Tax=Turnera subulata TaxID=218843 RepID=A0A9Q0FAU0_9ROSI|nr:hypothetical protein Tsubulata_050347 [Turnera subulata]